MEINVVIPENDYKQPTEVRQEAVQAICEAFLHGRHYHPKEDGCYRKRDYYVSYHSPERGWIFANERESCVLVLDSTEQK